MRPTALLALLALPLCLLPGCGGGVEGGEIPALVESARGGDAGASRALVQALGASDRELALLAYRGVLEAGPVCAPALLEALSGRDPARWEAAAAALANLREKKAVPALVEALGEGGPRAPTAAWALGMLGDPAAVGPLAKALATPRESLRRQAVRALVRMGSPAVEEAVLKAWSEDPAVERPAIRVLGEMRSRAALAPLLAAGEANRDAAVWALGRIADPAAGAAVRSAMGDSRWQVRREAAQALGALGDRGDEPLLRRALEDPEPVVREWGARSLMTITGHEVLYRDEAGKMVPPYNLFH